MGIVLDILTHDGSPTLICPTCLYGDEHRYGVGGSEYYLITLCEAWGNLGYTVRLYNDPHENYTKVDWMEQLPIEAFDPNEDRDILINFRSPSMESKHAKGLKCWLTTDQYSQEDYRAFAPHMDKIVCISPHHVDFFKRVYNIQNAIYIDIPVREKDFAGSENKVQIKNRLIFTSIPDRGLRNLLSIYPTLLKEIPDISLVITSDYRLWGASAQNEQYRVEWIKYMDTVQFRGALPRMRYINELSQASLMVYPSTYAELFCISVAEAQWAGVYTITSTAGALPTTNMGELLAGNPDTPEAKRLFIDKTIELCHNQDMLKSLQEDVQRKAKERFSLQRILQEWEKVFNE